jgi:hypothetical protein
MKRLSKPITPSVSYQGKEGIDKKFAYVSPSLPSKLFMFCDFFRHALKKRSVLYSSISALNPLLCHNNRLSQPLF